MCKLIFLSLLLFSLTSLSSFADCYTGFACNLQQLQNDDIKKQQSFINLINKYFEKKYIEKNYITDKFKINSYNEIFSFNTIL